MRQHGVRVLSERDRQLLRLIGEQYLVTLPQLAYLAGRSDRTARWLRTRWHRAGLVEAAALLVEEPTVVWLTRRGLAAVGLPWKQLRPSPQTVETAAALVELRLAAESQYPGAGWVSRRLLAHTAPDTFPLPDALLTSETTTVAVVLRLRPLDRRELDARVFPIIADHDHTLLVLPTVSRLAAEWIDEQGGRASWIGYRRLQRAVNIPTLPRLPGLEHEPADPSEEPGRTGAGVELLRSREELLAEARRDIAAGRARGFGRARSSSRA